MYTPGVIGEDGEIRPVDKIDEAYRKEDGHITRSYAHTVFREGAIAQEMMDAGESFFSGSSSTDFGSLVDRAVSMTLAGADLADLFLVPPADVLASDGSKKGKKYTDWRDAQAPESVIVSASDFDKVDRVLLNTIRNKAAKEIFDQTKDVQGAFRWKDKHGRLRKSLADGVTPSFLWDYKTTSSPWWDLSSSFARYGYIWQDAWYEDGAVANGWEPHRLRFIVAQSSKPFGVRVYELEQEAVDFAREQIDATLHQMELRKEIGIYRSVEDDEVLTLEMPAWAKGGL